MKFRTFDITAPLPFSQGFAIKAILGRVGKVGSRCLAAGEVDEQIDEAGTYLYIKLSYTEGDVRISESVWYDDGCSGVRCSYRRLNEEGPWFEHTGPEEWTSCNFEIEWTDVLTA